MDKACLLNQSSRRSSTEIPAEGGFQATKYRNNLLMSYAYDELIEQSSKQCSIRVVLQN